MQRPRTRRGPSTSPPLGPTQRTPTQLTELRRDALRRNERDSAQRAPARLREPSRGALGGVAPRRIRLTPPPSLLLPAPDRRHAYYTTCLLAPGYQFSTRRSGAWRCGARPEPSFHPNGEPAFAGGAAVTMHVLEMESAAAFVAHARRNCLCCALTNEPHSGSAR